jgi:hypothetical protein
MRHDRGLDCAYGHWTPAEQRGSQMDRRDVVALILDTRKAKGLTWKDLAAKVGKMSASFIDENLVDVLPA